MALFITLVNSTVYMVRYRLRMESGSSQAFIANNFIAATPNLMVDTIQASPLRQALNQAVAGAQEANEVLTENPALRFLVTSADANGTFGVEAADAADRPILVITGMNNNADPDVNVFGTLTIELRHTFVR